MCLMAFAWLGDDGSDHWGGVRHGSPIMWVVFVSQIEFHSFVGGFQSEPVLPFFLLLLNLVHLTLWKVFFYKQNSNKFISIWSE